MDRLPGPHAGEDPRAAAERPALRAGDPSARDAGRPGAPEQFAGRGAGAPQRHRRRAAQDGRPRGRRHRHMELSKETYTDGASRDWAVSKQTMQVVDNRVETEVALFEPSSTGTIGSAWCASSRSCCACPSRRSTRTLTPFVPGTGSAKASPGPRKAPLCIVNCRGQMLDCRRAAREGAAARGLLHLPRPRLSSTGFYRNASAVSFCDAQLSGATPPRPLPDWKEWCGDIEPALGPGISAWGRGTSPKVAMRGLDGWRYLRLFRAKGGDCVARVRRRCGGAREVDDQALRLPGPAPCRGR